MTDSTPAAGGLSPEERRTLAESAMLDVHDDGHLVADLAENVERIIASRTEAVDRERDGWMRRWSDMEAAARQERERLARVTAAVEALAGKWDADRLNRVIDKEAAADNLRAALSSADTLRRVRKPGPCWFRVAPAPCCRRVLRGW